MKVVSHALASQSSLEYIVSKSSSGPLTISLTLTLLVLYNFPMGINNAPIHPTIYVSIYLSIMMKLIDPRTMKALKEKQKKLIRKCV